MNFLVVETERENLDPDNLAGEKKENVEKMIFFFLARESENDFSMSRGEILMSDVDDLHSHRLTFG